MFAYMETCSQISAFHFRVFSSLNLPQGITMKAALRRTIRSRLNTLSPEYIHKQSSKIAETFTSLPAYSEARGICLFMALPHEVDTLAILRHALSHGKAVFLPRVISDTEMHMYRVYSLHDVLTLPTGRWGITEPLPRVKASELRPRALDPDAWQRLRGADGLPLPPPTGGCGASNLCDLSRVRTPQDNLQLPQDRDCDSALSSRHLPEGGIEGDNLPDPLSVQGICQRLGVIKVGRALGLLEDEHKAATDGDEAAAEEDAVEEWIDRSEASETALALADMVVMPGCAYDTSRQRLGYGRGYYDRYVKHLRTRRLEHGMRAPVCVGVCLEEQMVGTDEVNGTVSGPGVPVEAHDEAVDIVVTPCRVL